MQVLGSVVKDVNQAVDLVENVDEVQGVCVCRLPAVATLLVSTVVTHEAGSLVRIRVVALRMASEALDLLLVEVVSRIESIVAAVADRALEERRAADQYDREEGSRRRRTRLQVVAAPLFEVHCGVLTSVVAQRLGPVHAGLFFRLGVRDKVLR